MDEQARSANVEKILATPGLADALESDRFKQFLDHVPVAIAVAELHASETITYCNLEFERLTGQSAVALQGQQWSALPGVAAARDDETHLGEAVLKDDEYIGTFTIGCDEGSVEVDAWSNTIESDNGEPLFRLVALAKTGQRKSLPGEKDGQLLRDKDVQLRELQHRVKNNLQMITALIRMEARNVSDDETGARFNGLAGRINSLAMLYDLLSGEDADDGVDLGVYLSKIASSVMEAHAVEGVRLDLSVDAWPCSINVAMPTGLVVNELMTNALKYAFVGRDKGVISLSSLVDDEGCRVVVSDDGVGLAEGATWPQSGKLGAVITQSLRQNAKATLAVHSARGAGMRVDIFFARGTAEPVAL
ncbi:PAS domain-containing protein [Sphingomonas sp. AAP5]|uniref:sensor histidine kinase n=1 Tax=Sphingomonas sp. AAP5 TaxID=1523415 RepID=UPI0010572148|nr:histidine kinase dimerization/phosphoacceptor domain -containing protein [Sphingomonas sp. AAP5]QBM76633.1 PAS domain-containing protein [Sphingomonas sp. AAP5]